MIKEFTETQMFDILLSNILTKLNVETMEYIIKNKLVNHNFKLSCRADTKDVLYAKKSNNSYCVTLRSVHFILFFEGGDVDFEHVLLSTDYNDLCKDIKIISTRIKELIEFLDDDSKNINTSDLYSS